MESLDMIGRRHRQKGSGARLGETSRALQRAVEKAAQAYGIPPSQREAFLRWSVSRLAAQYKEDLMSNRMMIEDEIRSLGIRFPNGTVGKDYVATFSLPAGKVSDVGMEGAAALGLELLDRGDDTYILCGRPSQAGDFTLRLRYRTVEGEPHSELQVPIAFNPDPRKLWRDIATDETIPFYKPDSASAYVKVEAGPDGSPRKDMVAASQRGRSHAQGGKARDDDFALYHCGESDWYVMAVADGAGSAEYSRKGSEVACATAVDHCRSRLLDNPLFEDAIRDYAADRDNTEKRTEVTRQVIDIIYNGALKAHEEIKKVAAATPGTQLRDFATTLMFAVCKKYDFGWFVASFWVGDGAMCIYDEASGTAKLLGTPDEGEYSGQTRFLTMPEIFRDRDVVAKRLRMAIVPDFTALFLMSDGVSDPMFETDHNLNSFEKWREFYGRLKGGFPEDGIEGVGLHDDNEGAKDSLLGWLDFWSPGNHDDRTIAILY